MDVSIRKLKADTREILDIVRRGESVIIKSCGKICAMIVPMSEKDHKIIDYPAFGMWKNHGKFEDVGQYVRKLREGRKLVSASNLRVSAADAGVVS